MSKNISRCVLILALLSATIGSTANLYAADSKTDSEFYLRDEEFNLRKALTFKSADGDFSLRIGGRVHADAAWFLGDSNNVLFRDSRDTEFRRARLYASGKVVDDWRYRFEYDFASNNNFRIKSAWVGYTGFKPFTIRAGNVLEPFSLEAMTSSNNTTFMERALPKALTQSYKLGVLVNTYDENWSAAAGLFDGNIQNGSKDGWGAAARITSAPIRSRRRLLHIGAAVEYREPDEVNYSTRPEANLANRLTGTGTLRNVDSTIATGLEGAAVYDSFSLQGEYMRVNVARNNNRSDPSFDGWYVYGSWFLTGESRRYNVKKGVFKQIKPKSKYGAWELAARYSDLDIEDRKVTGGDESNVTLGANWYPNRNLRFMANYIWTDASPDRSGNNEDPDIFQLRAQFVF